MFHMNIKGVNEMVEDALKRKKEAWLEELKKKGKLIDPKEDHRIAWRTMQNRTRREILAFVVGGKSIEEIKEHFNLGDAEVKLHLDMLENALYVESVKKGDEIYYYPTPRGEEYLENVEKREEKGS